MADLISDQLADFAYIIPLETIQGTRSIGALIPDVVIEEVGDDVMQITKHPVQTGATISDHAFRMPSTLLMKIGFADYKHQQVGFTRQALWDLLAAMGSRQLLTIVTGKRVYQSMLYSHLHVTTDATTEYVLNAVVAFEEVLLTPVTGSLMFSSIPQSASPVVDYGTVSPVVEQFAQPNF
jgi:hypothetical protein